MWLAMVRQLLAIGIIMLRMQMTDAYGISNGPGRFEGPEKESWDFLTCNYTSRFASSTRRNDARLQIYHHVIALDRHRDRLRHIRSLHHG